MGSNGPRLLCAIALVAAACGDNLPAIPDASVDGAAGPGGDDYIEWRYPGEPGGPRVLVYTFENVWHHYSMIELRGAIINMNVTRGFSVTTTNHPLAINAK